MVGCSEAVLRYGRKTQIPFNSKFDVENSGGKNEECLKSS